MLLMMNSMFSRGRAVPVALRPAPDIRGSGLRITRRCCRQGLSEEHLYFYTFYVLHSAAPSLPVQVKLVQ